jgi:GAF domain-containing protein
VSGVRLDLDEANWHEAHHGGRMTDASSAETERLKELIRLVIMDTPPEQAYDEIAEMAAFMCSTPIALISLVDERRQWFKSAVGLTVPETPRHLAFCAHAIQAPEQTMVLIDTLQDPRFVDNALVIGEPNIRFYAGVPLVTSAGFALGTRCVIDRRPRQLTEGQAAYLEFMAREVVSMIEARRSMVV